MRSAIRSLRRELGVKPQHQRMKIHPGRQKCGRKVRFDTEYDADYIFRRMQEREIPPAGWYYHNPCHGFHITQEMKW